MFPAHTVVPDFRLVETLPLGTDAERTVHWDDIAQCLQGTIARA